MKLPWKRRNAEAKVRAEKAKAQFEDAQAEYQKTVRDSHLVSDVLAALLYQAEENAIMEKIQKVARGY